MPKRLIPVIADLIKQNSNTLKNKADHATTHAINSTEELNISGMHIIHVCHHANDVFQYHFISSLNHLEQPVAFYQNPNNVTITR